MRTHRFRLPALALAWALTSGGAWMAGGAVLYAAAGALPQAEGGAAAGQAAPDNTRRNKEQNEPTADQQKNNSADLATTQKIRKLISDDKGLSTYGKNIKVITENGKVTLRGPVNSQEEKRNLEAKASSVAGADNVTNQLEVAASK